MDENKIKNIVKKAVFALFFVSGFCSLLYQSVWLRLAYASFGINSQVMSIVISVFMLGLALGSWGAGSFISRFSDKYRINILYIYGLAELGIGAGAFVVPALFLKGRTWLLSFGQIDSLAYLCLSALVIAVVMLPWCLLMGATIPLMVEFFSRKIAKNKQIFSYLYLANTIGAIMGVVISAFVLIELFGFKGTLFIAAGFNAIVFFTSFFIARVSSVPAPNIPVPKLPLSDIASSQWSVGTEGESSDNIGTGTILFLTGFISLGLEVIWMRMFIPIIGTNVYSFAIILFLYLFGTTVGLWKYRYDCWIKKIRSTRFLLAVLVFSLLAQIFINEPQFNLAGFGIFISIFSFSCILGYLTPKQIDQKAKSSSRAVGKLYAVNIVGCIIGPLAASYILLPLFGAKFSIILLCLPLFYFLHILYAPYAIQRKRIFAAVFILLFICIFINTTYEDGGLGPNKIIKRDYSATVTAYSASDRSKGLFVNGMGMTVKARVTKIMAHLPLALRKEPAEKALIICLGMGTTFRSAMSWGIDATAIELVPGVKELFPYFFSDADIINQNPRGRIIVDDGRRYLQRSGQVYDLITIDPPPPVQTAGSSLLYSKDFYEIAKEHLSDKGILAQWYPEKKDETLNAVARSLVEIFPYVEVYKSLEGWGYHLLASKSPINSVSPEEFLKVMPSEAKKDMLEWNDENLSDLQYAQSILAGKMDINELLSDNKELIIDDNRPFNEYYFLRQYTPFLSE